MALKVVESESKITSDTTATVVIESDLQDGKAHYELERKGWETARDWAHKNGISSPGLGNTTQSPYAVNRKGEVIGTEQYNEPPDAPDRQAMAYRVDIAVHGRMR